MKDEDRAFKIRCIVGMLYYACVGGIIGWMIVNYLERHSRDELERVITLMGGMVPK